MSIPAFVCRATTSSTARHTRSSKAALSTGTPSSRAHIIAIRSSGRGRLPTCVVRKRLSFVIVLLVNGEDGGNGLYRFLRRLRYRALRALRCLQRREEVDADGCEL